MRLPGLLTILLLLAAPAGGADDFAVIVHPSVAGASIRRTDLSAIYLGKATRWGGGGLAVPVDQSGASGVRRAFSEAVLRLPVATVVQYWHRQVSGANPLRPPAVKGSDAEVVAFVAKTRGAVGYVSKAAILPSEVRAIAVVDQE
jgi:ABC-type phosphate transport system substrate-binding protein